MDREKQQVLPLLYPGFPVELVGVGELYAAFFNGKPHRRTLVRAEQQKSGSAPVPRQARTGWMTNSFKARGHRAKTNEVTDSRDDQWEGRAHLCHPIPGMEIPAVSFPHLVVELERKLYQPRIAGLGYLIIGAAGRGVIGLVK
jgi:hypothetical protein